MESARQHVCAKLKEVEREQHIRVLLAIEVGSHTWGYNSPNSDHDVRFLYLRPPEWYLRLPFQRQPDTMEIMGISRSDSSSLALNLTGWDMRKALHLLGKSNTTVLECLAVPSNLVYLELGLVLQLKDMAERFFSPRAVWYHYISEAREMVGHLLEDKVTVKEYLVALRAILAGLWIKQKGTFPPLHFDQLLDVTDQPVASEIGQLLQLRRNGGSTTVAGNEILRTFIMEQLPRQEVLARQAPTAEAPDLDALNRQFVAMLETIWRVHLRSGL